MNPRDYRKLHDNLGKALDRLPHEIRAATNGFLLNDRGEVLLQQRSDNGHWALPGGVLEIGESAADGAIREVEEETGIRTRVRRLVGVYSDPANFSIMRYPNGHLVHYVIVLFQVDYVSGSIKVSEESRQVGFFHPKDFPEPMLPAARIRIGDALQMRGEAFFK